MYGLSGILSLQQAMDVNSTATLAPLNPNNLHLGVIDYHPPKETNTYPKYTQQIFYEGTKLYLVTPAVHLKELQIIPHKLGQQIKVPVTHWLRQQLTIIDQFVSSNAKIPQQLYQAWPEQKRQTLYKPFFQGDLIYVLIGKFCTFTEGLSVDTTRVINPATFGSGLFSFTIEIPRVYIGPHIDGSLISCNSRIVRVHCEPDLTAIDSVIDNCIVNDDCVLTAVDSKKQRKRRVKTEVTK